MAISLKYISLIVLCIQNSSLALLMRIASTGEEKFNSKTAVVMGELLKILACIVLVMREGKHTSPVQVVVQAITDRTEMIRIAVPAVLYLIQNNLQYVSIANLDAATFQVLYQLKILTTALFSVTLLQKKILPMQWAAIVLLMCGVAMVQQDPSSTKPEENVNHNMFLGLITVLLACCCSGFAGVYFEKILKHQSSKTSLWERNIQMGIISGSFGLVAVFSNDAESIAQNGFFHGYRPIVWIAIAVNALGGLLTAVVVKYADNILKAFATSIAIVLSCILSIFLFDKIPTLSFLLGAFLVNVAVYIYGVSPSWQQQREEEKKVSLPAEKV